MTDQALETQAQIVLAAISRGGAPAGIAAVTHAAADPAARNTLYRLTLRKLAFGTWAAAEAPAMLDAMIALGDATIANALAAGLTDEANITAYNMAANLCDCWGDAFTRDSHHFEKGLGYAEQALTLRRALEKGPGPFAMAFWAKGKHLLSLGRYADAAQAFSYALEKETEKAEGATSDGMTTAAGFLALARYYEARAALAARGTEDCALFLDQLTKSERTVPAPALAKA